VNLATTYLGLTLKHPFMVGASPLTVDLDTVKRLEDGGSAAIVLHSLFEEQISMARSGRIHQRDPFETQFAGALSAFPPVDGEAPDRYLDQLQKIKAAVGIPVIASLNGMTTETWLTFAASVEQAGADALELNIYEVATDPSQSGVTIERDIRNAVTELKRRLRLPIGVKLTPFFTAFADVAHQLDRDVRGSFRRDLARDFRRYVLIEAWSPDLAFDALRQDLDAGTIFPTTFAIYELADGETAIMAKEPLAPIAVQRDGWRHSTPGLIRIAERQNERVARVLERLQHASSHESAAPAA
jgi:hypothetical protein